MWQVCAVPAGRQAVADQHGGAGAEQPHLPQPQVRQQADQVPHRRHRTEGDTPGGGGHPPGRRGGQEDVSSGTAVMRVGRFNVPVLHTSSCRHFKLDCENMDWSGFASKCRKMVRLISGSCQNFYTDPYPDPGKSKNLI